MLHSLPYYKQICFYSFIIILQGENVYWTELDYNYDICSIMWEFNSGDAFIHIRAFVVVFLDAFPHAIMSPLTHSFAWN